MGASRPSTPLAPPARAALLAFAAAMARRDVPAASRAVRRVRRARAPRRAAEETALMLVLHAGYPAALEGARVLSEAWPGRVRRSREGGVARWRARGVALCRRVYGPVYAKLVSHVRAMHPDLSVWMVEQGYGRVLSRPGLGAIDRELVAITVLAATGWERQLVSHLRGADRMGAPRAAIRSAWRTGVRVAEAEARAPLERAWRSAFGAREGGGMRSAARTPRRATAPGARSG